MQNQVFADLETSSSNYASRFAGPIGQWLLSVQSKLFLRLLNGSSSKGSKILHPLSGTFSLLDVGGGHGQIVRALMNSPLRNDCEITVLGSDQRCTEGIKEYLDSGSIKFSLGSPVHLPFADKAFDYVTSFRFIPHCEDWERHIGELCRVAKKGVIVDFPTYQSINFLSPIMFRLKKLLEGNTRTFILFSRYQIEAAFESNNWKTEQIVGEFSLPMVLHRVLKSPKISGMAEDILRAIGITKLFGSPLILKAVPKG